MYYKISKVILTVSGAVSAAVSSVYKFRVMFTTRIAMGVPGYAINETSLSIIIAACHRLSDRAVMLK